MERQLSEATEWRITAPGLCLEGRCTDRDCEAEGEMVILNKGFDDYDLVLGGTETDRCPCCYGDVTPITCTFNNCVWRYRGKKAGESNVLTGPSTEVGDSHERFNEGSEGAEWERLLFQVRRKLAVRREAAPEPSAGSAVSTVLIDHTWGVLHALLWRHARWGDQGPAVWSPHSPRLPRRLGNGLDRVPQLLPDVRDLNLGHRESN